MRTWIALVFLGSAIGCSSTLPQYNATERERLNRLQQSIASKQIKVVNQLCDHFKGLNEKGKLTDEQFSPIEKIRAKCEDQRWDDAATLCKSLLDGQGKT